MSREDDLQKKHDLINHVLLGPNTHYNFLVKLEASGHPLLSEAHITAINELIKDKEKAQGEKFDWKNTTIETIEELCRRAEKLHEEFTLGLSRAETRQRSVEYRKNEILRLQKELGEPTTPLPQDDHKLELQLQGLKARKIKAAEEIHSLAEETLKIKKTLEKLEKNATDYPAILAQITIQLQVISNIDAGLEHHRFSQSQDGSIPSLDKLQEINDSLIRVSETIKKIDADLTIELRCDKAIRKIEEHKKNLIAHTRQLLDAIKNPSANEDTLNQLSDTLKALVDKKMSTRISLLTEHRKDTTATLISEHNQYSNLAKDVLGQATIKINHLQKMQQELQNAITDEVLRKNRYIQTQLNFIGAPATTSKTHITVPTPLPTEISALEQELKNVRAIDVNKKVLEIMKAEHASSLEAAFTELDANWDQDKKLSGEEKADIRSKIEVVASTAREISNQIKRMSDEIETAAITVLRKKATTLKKRHNAAAYQKTVSLEEMPRLSHLEKSEKITVIALLTDEKTPQNPKSLKNLCVALENRVDPTSLLEKTQKSKIQLLQNALDIKLKSEFDQLDSALDFDHYDHSRFSRSKTNKAFFSRVRTGHWDKEDPTEILTNLSGKNSLAAGALATEILTNEITELKTRIKAKLPDAPTPEEVLSVNASDSKLKAFLDLPEKLNSEAVYTQYKTLKEIFANTEPFIAEVLKARIEAQITLAKEKINSALKEAGADNLNPFSEALSNPLQSPVITTPVNSDVIKKLRDQLEEAKTLVQNSTRINEIVCDVLNHRIYQIVETKVNKLLGTNRLERIGKDLKYNDVDVLDECVKRIPLTNPKDAKELQNLIASYQRFRAENFSNIAIAVAQNRVTVEQAAIRGDVLAKYPAIFLPNTYESLVQYAQEHKLFNGPILALSMPATKTENLPGLASQLTDLRAFKTNQNRLEIALLKALLLQKINAQLWADGRAGALNDDEIATYINMPGNSANDTATLNHYISNCNFATEAVKILERRIIAALDTKITNSVKGVFSANVITLPITDDEKWAMLARSGLDQTTRRPRTATDLQGILEALRGCGPTQTELNTCAIAVMEDRLTVAKFVAQRTLRNYATKNPKDTQATPTENSNAATSIANQAELTPLWKETDSELKKHERADLGTKLSAYQAAIKAFSMMSLPENEDFSLQQDLRTEAAILHYQSTLITLMSETTALSLTQDEINRFKPSADEKLLAALQTRRELATTPEEKAARDAQFKLLQDATRNYEIKHNPEGDETPDERKSRLNRNAAAEKAKELREQMLTEVLKHSINSVRDRLVPGITQLSREQIKLYLKDTDSVILKDLPTQGFFESQADYNTQLIERLNKLGDASTNNEHTKINEALKAELYKRDLAFTSATVNFVVDSTGFDLQPNIYKKILNQVLPISDDTLRNTCIAQLTDGKNYDIIKIINAAELLGLPTLPSDTIQKIAMLSAIETLRQHLLPEHNKRSFDNNNEDHDAWMTSDTSQLSNDQLKVLLNNLNWYNRLLNPISFEQVDSLANAFSADEYSKIADLLSSAQDEADFEHEDIRYHVTPASDKHITYDETNKCLTAKYLVDWTEKNASGTEEKKQTQVELRGTLSEDNKERKVTWHVASKTPIPWEMESAMVARNSLKTRIAEQQKLVEKITRLRGCVPHMVDGPQKKALRAEMIELQEQLKKFNPRSISLTIKNDPGKPGNHELSENQFVYCSENVLISMKEHFKAGYEKICIDNKIYTNPHLKSPQVTADSSEPSTLHGHLASVVENKVANRLETLNVLEAIKKDQLFVQVKFESNGTHKTDAFEKFLKANVRALADAKSFKVPVVVAIPVVMTEAMYKDFEKKFEPTNFNDFFKKLALSTAKDLGLPPPPAVSVVPLLILDGILLPNTNKLAEETLKKHISERSPVLCCARPGDERLISGDHVALARILNRVKQTAETVANPPSPSMSPSSHGSQ